MQKRNDLRRKLIKRKRYKKLSHALLSLTIGFYFVILFVGFEVTSYVQNVSDKIADPDDIANSISLATKIYDRNAVELYKLYDDRSNRENLDIEKVNPKIKAIFIASEDDTFYEHGGVDFSALTRCAAKILLSDNTCGASTITQQVVKIATEQNELTVERKLTEMLSAKKVEEKFAKDEILEMYLNLTPYGSNITGLKTASRFYFGQDDVNKLSVRQIITLAAIVNDPINLSPTLNPDRDKALKKLEERVNYIYSQLDTKLNKINSDLQSNGDDSLQFLTNEEVQNSRSEVITYKVPNMGDIKAPHFVNYTITELQRRNYKYGTEPFTLEDLQSGGYRIFTSLDYNLQQVAERYTNFAGNNYKYWNVHNAALMTIRPSNGEIITMAGSRSFTEGSEGCDASGNNCKFDPQVNVLTTLQSPGSTNKPLGYYLAFEESKLFPGSFLPDIPIAFGSYVPKNWDGNYLGAYNATAREMLRKSRNIPALEVVSLIGVDKYLNRARDFGYTSYGDNGVYGPSVILGGGDVYPTEHIQAYGVFANGGDFVRINPILKIEDRFGNLVYQSSPAKVKVGDPAASYLLNQSLYNLDVGTGETISWDGRDVAGKTGTTENNKDSFLIMYSPDFVTLGWAGNNNNEPLDLNYGWPAFVVTPWLKGYMNEVGLSQYFASKTPFPKPENVYEGGGDCDYFGKCLGLARDWLISGREPARGDVSLFNKDGKWVKTFTLNIPELQYYINAYFAGRKVV